MTTDKIIDAIMDDINIVEYRKPQSHRNICFREILTKHLKTLQPERDEVEKGGCKRCHGEILPHNIFCGPTCADLYERGK